MKNIIKDFLYVTKNEITENKEAALNVLSNARWRVNFSVNDIMTLTELEHWIDWLVEDFKDHDYEFSFIQSLMKENFEMVFKSKEENSRRIHLFKSKILCKLALEKIGKHPNDLPFDVCYLGFIMETEHKIYL